MTLDEYLASRAEIQHPLEKSGIECPECREEMNWDGMSLFAKEPPMRRVTCGGCGFSTVVPI